MASTFDLSGLRSTIARVAATPKKAEQAISRTKGTLARRIVPEARRDIQTEYPLTATRINKGLYSRPDAEGVVLVGEGRGIGLIEFGGRHSRRQAGASAQARVDEPRHIYAGTFIAAGKNGNRQIFQRSRKARLPIEPLYGPTIAAMIRRPGRADRLADFARSLLSAEIERQFR